LQIARSRWQAAEVHAVSRQATQECHTGVPKSTPMWSQKSPSFERAQNEPSGGCCRVIPLATTTTMSSGCIGSEDECERIWASVGAAIRDRSQQAVRANFEINVRAFSDKYGLSEEQQELANVINFETFVPVARFALELSDPETSFTSMESYAQKCWREGRCGSENCTNIHIPNGCAYIKPK
jgi:hypothetical protein